MKDEPRVSLARTMVVSLVSALVSLPVVPGWIGAAQAPSEVDEWLRGRIEASADRSDEWIRSVFALPAFYEERAYAPVWVSDTGIRPFINELIQFVERVDADGLVPVHYHLDRIQTLLARVRAVPGGTAILVELELRATDAFLQLASHLVAGRIDPESLQPEWVAVRREVDPVGLLRDALVSGDITGTLEGLAPANSGYRRLRQARARYEEIALAGGWPVIPSGPNLELEMIDPRVSVLRRRLQVTGDLAATDSDTTRFDQGLEDAVLAFQQRHGLDADGIVGPATLAALNLSAQERVRQIDINLERWRWLPEDLGERYILLNIPNFEMELIENGEVTMSMRAVVGRTYRRTPVFSDRISYLVFNPRWNVPPGIAIQDILPRLRSDPGYLANQNMRLFRGWGADQVELRQSDVDWSQVTAQSFVYHLRQEPDATNALGRVKFMFPNRFNVYMHDTPSRELFSRNERTFSSGCIRLERALDLAAYLLARDRGWTPSQVDAVLARNVEESVALVDPLPIHILYWTAWVDEAGPVQFRNDIYGRDVELRQALDEEFRMGDADMVD